MPRVKLNQNVDYNRLFMVGITSWFVYTRRKAKLRRSIEAGVWSPCDSVVEPAFGLVRAEETGTVFAAAITCVIGCSPRGQTVWVNAHVWPGTVDPSVPTQVPEVDIFLVFQDGLRM